MIREADIDAVDICTVHKLHAPLAVMAAQAGKHVLVEKPMACSLSECRRMVEEADKAGITLMIAQNQRYMPSYRGVRRVIRDGEIGAIRAVRLDAMQNLLVIVPPPHWLYDAQLAGGGVVISVAVHRLDLIRFLVGEVRSVGAICRTTHPEFTNGAEDFAAATFEFANGAIGELFATYSGFRMPWSEQFMIFGDTGTVHAVPPFGQALAPAQMSSLARNGPASGWGDMFHGFDPVEDAQEELPTGDSFINEILHFAECCRTGAGPISSGRDNVNTMKIIFGIYASAREGRPVELTSL
jgi:predicted dehydrogenase